MMFSSVSEKYKPKKILVISLSNIGDVILTCPVIDSLIEHFKKADISVVVGPKASGLFEENPHIRDIIIFDKHQSSKAMLAWLIDLRRKNFDVIVDLRRTAIPLFLHLKFFGSLLYHSDKKQHMRDKHFSCLKHVVGQAQEARSKYAIFLDDVRSNKVLNLLNRQTDFIQKYYIIAPGSANPNKRWTSKGFAQVINFLEGKIKSTAVFVGDQGDFDVAQDIISLLSAPGINLCGKLHLLDVACLLRQSHFVLAVDSAISHLASYLDIPVLTLFGPSDPSKYGPWGKRGFFLKGNVFNGNKEPSLDTIEPKEVMNILDQNFLS